MNDGTYDGFGNGQFGDPWAYTTFDGDKLPNYWRLGAATTCSATTSSPRSAAPRTRTTSSSWPGQSGGAIDNPENIEVRFDDGDRQFKSWGCDAVGDDVFVLVKDDQGNLTKHDSCFDFQTVPEQLEEAGVSWAYYSASPYQTGYFWNALNGVADVFHTDLWRHETHPRPSTSCLEGHPRRAAARRSRG